MEPRGRRGARPPLETAAPEGPSAPVSGDPMPESEPPFAGPSPADEGGAHAGDSLTALAAAEEAMTEASEFSAAPAEPPPAEPREAPDRDALTALARAHAALACGLAALGVEIAGLACTEFTDAARAASRLLAVATPSEAARLHADYWQRSLDAALSGSVRLSNLGVAVAAGTAEPLVAQFARNWLEAAQPAG